MRTDLDIITDDEFRQVVTASKYPRIDFLQAFSAGDLDHSFISSGRTSANILFIANLLLYLYYIGNKRKS